MLSAYSQPLPPPQSYTNNSTPADEMPKKKRSARLLDDNQRKILYEFFTQNAFPSIEERQSLASQVNVGPRKVQTWFQNKRQSIRQSNLNLTLHQYSLNGAGLHSPERDPTPRCHRETRLNLRRNIQTWLADEEREQDILWLFGPAGVGKSAVAQTIGELAEGLGVLGAAVFFSRGRKTDNSSLFFTSVASQLCKGRSSYANLLMRVLQEQEFVVTNSDGRTQFKELLIKPFSDLIQNRAYSNKVLIIIDGLDECQGEDQQLDLVRLIVEATRDQDSSHFLWMIFSRLEHHLKELFYTEGLSDVCLRLDLLPQEEGAHDDIERYLRDGLERIAERYSSGRSSNIAWSVINDPVNLDKLVRTASGTFVVASSLLGFIGDPVIADPISQMQIALDTIDGISVTSSSGNPLAPLDALYVGVLKEVGNTIRPKTLQLLGSCVVAPPIPALHLANLIAFTEEDFCSALRILHAFLSVPHHTEATQESLHFFHASFPDFLSHNDRSGDYFQDPDLHRFELAKAFFHAVNSTDRDYSQNLSWLPPDGSQDEGQDGAEGAVESEGEGGRDEVRSESDDEVESESEDEVESEIGGGIEDGGENEDKTVLPDPESPLSVSHDIQGFAAAHVWELCTRISKPQEWKPLLEMVASFDFRRLQKFCDAIPVQPFIRFIRWLHKLGKDEPKLKHIVRVDIQFGTDQKLLKKCTPVAQPLDLETSVEVYDLDKSPRFAFAGFKKKTVVILFVPETVMMYSLDDVNHM